MYAFLPKVVCSLSPPPPRKKISCPLATPQSFVFKKAIVGPRSQQAQAVLHSYTQCKIRFNIILLSTGTPVK